MLHKPIRCTQRFHHRLRILYSQLTCFWRPSDLSCSGLVTTPAEVVEEGSGLGGDAGLGGHLLGADGDGG